MLHKTLLCFVEKCSYLGHSNDSSFRNIMRSPSNVCAPLCKPPRSMKRLHMYVRTFCHVHRTLTAHPDEGYIYIQLPCLSMLAIMKNLKVAADFNAESLVRYDMWDAPTEREREPDESITPLRRKTELSIY